MNWLIIMLSLLTPLVALSDAYTGKSVCGEEGCDFGEYKKTIKDSIKLDSSSPRGTIKTQKIKKPVITNLPIEYSLTRRGVNTGDISTHIITPKEITGAVLKDIRSGDILNAIITQSIKASPSVPTPIRARVISKTLYNAFFLGNATLDRELKRILISFNKIRLPSSSITYEVKADVLSPSGQVGLEGEYNSNEGLYFAGELLSAGAAGYTDSTIARQQTIFGNYVDEPSALTSAKKGAATALSKSTERFAEKARSAPEYTEVEGGRLVQIIIETNPREEQER